MPLLSSPRPISLNCLICQGRQRTNSDLDFRCAGEDNCLDGLCGPTAERNWSSPLISGHPKAGKGRHRRLRSSGPMAFGRSQGVGAVGEPRLVRSWGMRRNWSFENLDQRRDGKRREETVRLN